MRTKTLFIFKTVLSLFLIYLSGNAYAQFIPKDYDGAFWITVPDIVPDEYGVYYFRKSLVLDEIPMTVPVRVSGDSRYVLYVNGRLVSQGPAKSDLKHWNYERVDLAQYLRTGENVLSARVVNEGELHAESHLSKHTAFMIAGENEDAQKWDTDNTWICIKDNSYAPFPTKWSGYIAVSPGDIIDMNKHVSDWREYSCNLSSWKQAEVLSVPMYRDSPIPYGTATIWLLKPSDLPQMEMSVQRINNIRTSSVTVSEGFLEGKAPLTIPANTETVILLDQQYVTNAFVNLIFSKGNNANISLTYQESLYLPHKEGDYDDMGKALYKKGNRNDVENMVIGGRKDSIISNGSDMQKYETLTWRTYRYIQLKINTHDQPLIINDIYGIFTGYPFDLASTVETDNEEIKNILEIGWRTARLCAHETYMDCPYYEQLQYLGDTRIQALITLYNTRDDRLVKNFLTQADISRQAEGVTLSRYPSTTDQIIPGYSLVYILSLYDYMMYGNDGEFVAQKLPGVRQILSFYSNFQQNDGRVKGLPWWNFSDWVEHEGWNAGIAPYGTDGCSAITDLFLLLTYQAAAKLENAYGMFAYKELYVEKAELLKNTILNKYWDNNRKLFSDDADHQYYSQHTNALAILADIIDNEQALSIAKTIIEDEGLAKASVYFTFYLNMALAHAGLGNDYLSWLNIYRENMKMGLTTWAETSILSTTRSDCHAWGASPNIEFFRIVLGIDSGAPNFSKVRIAPHIGKLKEIGGSIPWRDEKIVTHYKNNGKYMEAIITLPKGLSGTFIWNEKEYRLKGGKNIFNLSY